MLITAVIAGCSKENEDDCVDSYYSNVAFAGVWNVSEVNIGGTWQDAKTASYKDTQIIITEDSCYQSFGKFGKNYGRYRIKDGKANCIDYYGKLCLVCQFKNVNSKTATAAITNKDGVTLDFRLTKDDGNPALYLDPLKYLNGYWDVDGEEGSYVHLRGYAADIHTSKMDECGFWVHRATWDINGLMFGETFIARFDLSKEPYVLTLSGNNSNEIYRNRTLTCIKRPG